MLLFPHDVSFKTDIGATKRPKLRQMKTARKSWPAVVGKIVHAGRASGYFAAVGNGTGFSAKVAR